jgi:hypothetical protein
VIPEYVSSRNFLTSVAFGKLKEKYKSVYQHNVIDKIFKLAEIFKIELIVDGLNTLSNSASFYADLQQGLLHR